jgi:nucleoid DNA-binding protein
MIRYILKQCKNVKQAIYGKLFAYPVIEETINEDDLAAHMASHNTPFSQGAIKGMLTDMVHCIHELLLEGKNVKISNWPSSPSASRTPRAVPITRKTSPFRRTSRELNSVPVPQASCSPRA